MAGFVVQFLRPTPPPRQGRDDPDHWMGASADGLISLPAGAHGLGPQLGARGGGGGVLEVKCPFNRGSPREARPPHAAQWYYMAQVKPQALNPSSVPALDRGNPPPAPRLRWRGHGQYKTSLRPRG